MERPFAHCYLLQDAQDIERGHQDNPYFCTKEVQHCRMRFQGVWTRAFKRRDGVFGQDYVARGNNNDIDKLLEEHTQELMKLDSVS